MEHGIDHKNPVNLSQIPHVTAHGEEKVNIANLVAEQIFLGKNVRFFSD